MDIRRLETTYSLVIRIIFLIIFVISSTYLFFIETYILSIVFGLISLLFLSSIMSLFKKSLKKITLMFDAIENNDNSFRFVDKHYATSADAQLNHYLNRVKALISDARDEVRESEKYFEVILNQINTGILVINAEGIVLRVNKFALELFSLSILSHINQLSALSPEIVTQLRDIKEGKNLQAKFYNESRLVRLSLGATEIKLQNKNLKIITITDIVNDIDQAEIDSWSRMSRVFTHEIMNSLAPINAISESLAESNDLEYISKGIEIIRTTSIRLSSFVESYRSLTRIPTPVLEDIDIVDLVSKEITLTGKNIEINIGNGSYRVLADQNQISQVLINLLKNAVEALDPLKEENVWINIGLDSDGKVFVEVCNNGSEISDEMRDNIFVPFFTTKEQGSGIGLSLSRQIMRLHEGNLTLTTKPYTCFRIKFA